MIALLLHVQILGLLHPQRALVDGVEAKAGHRYGGQRFTIEVGSLKRTYPGSLRVEDGGHELRLINVVDLEDYVASVVAAEQDRGPLAAREALAIVVRSFAIYRGVVEEHLCDTTHCQWYRGLEHTDIDAARRTRGEVLLLKGHVPPVFYSADCGGQTKKARDVWPGASQEAQEASLRSVDAHAPGGASKGHGVGLCQRGALFLASKGASAHQILARYFPALRIGRR